MTETMGITLMVLFSVFHFQQTEAQNTVSGTENNGITLPCVLTGSFTLPEWRGPPNLIIYTDQDAASKAINPAAPASDRLQFASNEKDLILSNAQLNDSGVYKCTYTALGDYTVTLTVTAEPTTTSISTNSTTASITIPSTTTTTTPTPIPSSLSDEMIIVIVVVPVGVIALVGAVIFFYRQQRGTRKPASDKRQKRGKHYKGNMGPVQQQPYMLYGRHHTGESTNKDSKRSRSLHNVDRNNWYDGSQVKQNPVYKGDRNLSRFYYNETLPRYDEYRSGYTRGHAYPSNTSGYHYRPDYHGDSRQHGNRQYSSYPTYSRQQEYIDPSYSYMGY